MNFSGEIKKKMGYFWGMLPWKSERIVLISVHVRNTISRLHKQVIDSRTDTHLEVHGMSNRKKRSTFLWTGLWTGWATISLQCRGVQDLDIFNTWNCFVP